MDKKMKCPDCTQILEDCPKCHGTTEIMENGTNKKLCEICTENYVDEAGVCYTCAKNQIRRLIIKCKRCGSYVVRGRERGDKLDQIDDLIDKKLADISDLKHNGFGFILRINWCILCKQ